MNAPTRNAINSPVTSSIGRKQVSCFDGPGNFKTFRHKNSWFPCFVLSHNNAVWNSIILRKLAWSSMSKTSGPCNQRTLAYGTTSNRILLLMHVMLALQKNSRSAKAWRGQRYNHPKHNLLHATSHGIGVWGIAILYVAATQRIGSLESAGSE